MSDVRIQIKHRKLDQLVADIDLWVLLWTIAYQGGCIEADRDVVEVSVLIDGERHVADPPPDWEDDD